ncbi:class I SAM-dependent methyltransferase [bacterium]|jgi:2-polyprenyl-3-methyl-5-hydroxy-6-metoxy-1,4-benzoquinol methylase|nr:class I SAM-dependent methyltransferase [bacterium]
MNKEIQELKKYIGEKQSCIVCQEDKFTKYAEEDYFQALKCDKCGMISVNPHYTEEGLDKFYSSYYKNRSIDNELSELRRVMYAEDRDWIHKFTKKGKVLDVGCSDGNFLDFFDEKLWDRHGIDLTSDALTIAKEKGVVTHQGKIWETDVGDGYDLVMMRGVIEHFRDPIVALKKCSEILKPGGILFITATPSGNSFAFNVYRHKWRLFTPYEHIHFFTVDLLSKVLNDMNMELLARHYQYEETPYANYENDFNKIIRDIEKIKLEGGLNNVELSAPFPGSMLTAAWTKNTEIEY